MCIVIVNVVVSYINVPKVRAARGGARRGERCGVLRSARWPPHHHARLSALSIDQVATLEQLAHVVGKLTSELANEGDRVGVGMKATGSKQGFTVALFKGVCRIMMTVLRMHQISAQRRERLV